MASLVVLHLDVYFNFYTQDSESEKPLLGQ